MSEQANTVFEIGQKVSVYDECDHYICDGVIDCCAAIRDGEEFYDVQTDGGYGLIRDLSEMRLADA